jgi:hypothetical protein
VNPRPAELEPVAGSPLASGGSRAQLPTSELMKKTSRTPRLPNTKRPRRVRRHRRCQRAPSQACHRRRGLGMSRPITLPAFAHLGPSRDSTRFRSLRQRHAMLWEASRSVSTGTRVCIPTPMATAPTPSGRLTAKLTANGLN